MLSPKAFGLGLNLFHWIDDVESMAIYRDEQRLWIIVYSSLIDDEECRAESFLLVQEFQKLEFTFALCEF